MKNRKSTSKHLLLIVIFWLWNIIDCFTDAGDNPLLSLIKLFMVLIGLAIWIKLLGPWVKNRAKKLDEQDQREVYFKTAFQYSITWVLVLGELLPHLVTNMAKRQYPDSEIEYILIGIVLMGVWLTSLNGLTNYKVLSIQIKPPLLYWTRFFPITAVSAVVAWFSKATLGVGMSYTIVCSIFIVEFVLVWLVVFLRYGRQSGTV